MGSTMMRIGRRVSLVVMGTLAGSLVLGAPLVFGLPGVPEPPSLVGAMSAMPSSPSHGAATLSHGITTRVSLSSKGEEGHMGSASPGFSGDGRLVAFTSPARNLVPNDTNGELWDAFVQDRLSGDTPFFGDTILVSRGSDGRQCMCQSGNPALSADGRYVAFSNLDCVTYTHQDCQHPGLVPEDTNDKWDVFVRDLETGTTERVSGSSSGGQGNGDSGRTSAISADGRYVVFVSEATNLVPGDTNAQPDVFVHDRVADTTERVSVNSFGEQANGWSDFWGNANMSADGRYVVFWSLATNLDPADPTGGVFVHDRETGRTESVDLGRCYGDYDPAISADGRYVIFKTTDPCVAEDTNKLSDAFVRDLRSQTLERISVDSEGRQGERGNGCHYDCLGALYPVLSADGRYSAFISQFANLVPDDTNRVTDVFWHDRITGRTVRVSVNSKGEQGNSYGGLGSGDWNYPAITPDGADVAFDSYSTNLVENDTNGTVDVFARSLIGH